MELLAFGIMRDIHCHADAEDLESYSMGASSLEETARIEEHLLICEDCRNRLRAGEDFLNSVQLAARQWRRDEKAAKGSGWKMPVWLPVLAAACGLVLVVVAIRVVRPGGPAVAVSLIALRGNDVRQHRSRRPGSLAASGPHRPRRGACLSLGNRRPDGPAGTPGGAPQNAGRRHRPRARRGPVLCPPVPSGGQPPSRVRAGNSIAVLPLRRR